jgi:hypothetical protein
MEQVEIKARIFDLLREIESLVTQKNELLKQLESIPNVGLRTPNIDVTGQ